MNNDRIVKGLLGSKLGMTQLWDEDNKVVPVTVIQAGPCVVTQVRTPEKDGYSAVQLGFGAIKSKNVTKPMAGHFAAADVTPRRHLLELRTADASEYTLGQELTTEVFSAGTSGRDRCQQGKGTSGVMKRHASQVFGAATVCTASTATRVRSGSPPLPVGSRASGWLGRAGAEKVTVQNLKTIPWTPSAG